MRLLPSLALLLFAWLALSWATPAPACSLCSCSTTATSISFGNYSPVSSAPLDASGTISVNCSGLVSLFGWVEIHAGPGNSGSATQRIMSRSGSTLRYNLYANSARTQILGDGTGGTYAELASLNGLLFFSTSVPVYARVPAGQWVNSGTYTDTVVVTVYY